MNTSYNGVWTFGPAAARIGIGIFYFTAFSLAFAASAEVFKNVLECVNDCAGSCGFRFIGGCDQWWVT